MNGIPGGYLITFEGIGGSGKSTLARMLLEHLAAQSWDVRPSREPGATPLGLKLREILLSGKVPTSPWTEAFLFEADRAQTFSEVLRPALAAGAILVSDRGPFGTIAYQAFGRELELGVIDQMNKVAWGGREPDLVFVVDVEPQLGLSRKAGAVEHDRFDRESLAYTARVREGYLFAAERFGANAVVVDGSAPLDDAFDRVRSVASERLATREAETRDPRSAPPFHRQ